MTSVRLALALAALLTALSACGSTPTKSDASSGPCDMQQPVGACVVRIEITRGRAVVCSEQPAAAAPVCMNVGLDLTSAKDGYMSRKVLLAPGQCRTLGSALASAAQASCDAYAARSPVAAAGQ
jgi:hypothetical protein